MSGSVAVAIKTPDAAIAAVAEMGLDERAFRVEEGSWVMVVLRGYWEKRAFDKFLAAGGLMGDWLSFLKGITRVPEGVREVRRLWDSSRHESVYLYRPSKIALVRG